LIDQLFASGSGGIQAGKDETIFSVDTEREAGSNRQIQMWRGIQSIQGLRVNGEHKRTSFPSQIPDH
jgi:hypothetical protein